MLTVSMPSSASSSMRCCLGHSPSRGEVDDAVEERVILVLEEDVDHVVDHAVDPRLVGALHAAAASIIIVVIRAAVRHSCSRDTRSRLLIPRREVGRRVPRRLIRPLRLT